MTDRTSNRTRNRRILFGLAGLAVIVIAGGLFWFFNRTVPEEANLESAVAAVTGESTTTTAATSSETSTTTTEAPPETGTGDGVDGTWFVDTTIGDFSFEEASATFAGFRINEVLAGNQAVTAVGRSPEVSGSLELAGTTLTAATFEVDMTAIITNDSRRDSRVQSAIKSSQHPTATFTLTEPLDFGQIPAEGEVVTGNAVGDLTVAGVTNQIVMPLEAQLVDGDKIIVVGSVNIVFSDYDVEVPSAPIVVSAEDNGILEVQIWLTR